ncbi:hypothetical protein [Arthrospira sp. PCC 8006]|uniref:hypothetical protein n=1 Tax=Arthrospira sp. PCC 8006 TaxID=1982224 RepID=UPI00396F39EA
MVNYPQSWRSRSLSEVRPIAYPLGSATYRLPLQKCDRVASECDVSPSLGVRRIA